MAKKQLSILTAITTGILVFAVACTSIKTIEMSPDQLHKQIRDGDILNLGDRILVVTSDEERHELSVLRVDETFVHGKMPIRSERLVHGRKPVEFKEVSIPIDNIVAMKTRDFSLGKTALFVGSTHYIMLLLIGGLAAGFL